MHEILNIILYYVTLSVYVKNNSLKHTSSIILFQIENETYFGNKLNVLFSLESY